MESAKEVSVPLDARDCSEAFRDMMPGQLHAGAVRSQMRSATRPLISKDNYYGAVGVSRRVDLDSRDGWLGKTRVEAAAAIHGAPPCVISVARSASHSALRINVHTSHSMMAVQGDITSRTEVYCSSRC